MPYSLYNRSFGQGFAGTSVIITDLDSGEPATILSSASGGVLNNRGIAVTDVSGNIAVYLDDSKTWKFTLQEDQILETTVNTSSRLIKRDEVTTLVGKPGITYIVDTPPHELYTWNGTALARVTPAEVAFLSSAVVPGTWRGLAPGALPAMRVRITGTGTLTMDSRTRSGTISTAVYTATASGTEIIDFAYAGDAAVEVRFNVTGTVAVEIL